MRNDLTREELETQIARMVATAPESLNKAVLDDREFGRQVNLQVTTTLSSPGGRKVTLDEFVRVLKEVVEGATKVTIRMAGGETEEVEAVLDPDLSVVLKTAGGSLRQHMATLLANDVGRRLEAFDIWCAEVMPPRSRMDHWRKRLEGEGLSDLEYWQLCREAEYTPESLHDGLQEQKHLTVRGLVPLESFYWDCLLPPAEGDFQTWRDGALVAWKKDLGERPSKYRLSRIGFSNAIVARLPDDFANCVDAEALDVLAAQEDPFSLLLALELSVLTFSGDDRIVARGKGILDRLFSDTEESKQRFEMMSAAIVLAHWGLQDVVSWRKAPLYWRRAAVMAQAGVLTNALIRTLGDVKGVTKWAMRAAGFKFYLGSACDGRQAPRWGIERIGERALRGTLFKHAFETVTALPEDKRPLEWLERIETVSDKWKTTGELGMALLAGPWADFEGYKLPYDRKDFKGTLKALEEKTVPAPGIEPFVHGVPLTAEDVRLLEVYAKGFVFPADNVETGLYLLSILAEAAAIYRDGALANVIAHRCMEVFPTIGCGLEQRLLAIILEASNAHSTVDAGLSWSAKHYEGLAWSASNVSTLDDIEDVVASVRGLQPVARPYFAATEAIIKLRKPVLMKKTP